MSPAVGSLKPLKEFKEEYLEDGSKVKVLVNGYKENHKQKTERLREILANLKANGYYICWACAGNARARGGYRGAQPKYYGN